MMIELVKALGYRQVLAILAVFVGFASSFAIVLSGLHRWVRRRIKPPQGSAF